MGKNKGGPAKTMAADPQCHVTLWWRRGDAALNLPNLEVIRAAVPDPHLRQLDAPHCYVFIDAPSALGPMLVWPLIGRQVCP